MSKIKKKVKKLRNKIKGSKKISAIAIVILISALLYYFKSVFVAATVDGSPITRLSLIQRLESQAGQQTLDDLITRRLVLQEAEKQGIQIGDEVIDQEIERLKGVVAAQGTTLDEALALQGQTIEGLEDNIRLQKTVEELLKEEIQVSEEEARQFFEENKNLYEEGANYEDLEEDIKNQLKQQNLQQEFQTLLQRLRQEANINYYVDF